MSRWRPGVWSQVFKRMTDSLREKTAQRTVVGKDSLGNVYYEESNKSVGADRNALRGYIPGDQVQWQRLPPEWEAWLRNRRKLPPSDQEIAQNEQDYALRMQRIEALGTGGHSAKHIEESTRPIGTEEAVGERVIL